MRDAGRSDWLGLETKCRTPRAKIAVRTVAVMAWAIGWPYSPSKLYSRGVHMSPPVSTATMITSALNNLTPADQLAFFRYGLGPDRPVPFPVIHHAFEAQARAQPEAIAVEHTSFNHSLTYHQLDVQANRLARRLRALGIVPGKRVCILVKRSVYLVVALLAVLKSGGQYVPLDAVTITDTALNYVLDNAKPSAVLVMDEFAHRLHSKLQVPTLNLEDVIMADELSDADATKPEDTTSPSDGAYVVYTSGTTGVPKGVDVRHCGVTNGITVFAVQLCCFLIAFDYAQ